MSIAHARERCEQLTADLDLPDSFTIETFCRRLGLRRGKPIQLLGAGEAQPLPATGVWIELADRDVVIYDETTSPFHQQLIVAHEIGHMVCNHYPGSVLPDELSAALFPSLNPALIQRILNRTDYSNDEEREAELFATLLLQRAGKSAEDGRPRDPQEAALLTQLGSTFEE